MKSFVGMLMIVGLALLAPLPARANDPSASIPTPADSGPVPRHWQGTATEVPGIYSGPAVAKVSLELKPDGTFTQTWKQGSQELETSGTWREEGDRIILTSSEPMRPRMILRHRGNALYAVGMEELPTGRATTTAIELHPAAS
jgi:hypothetical protein